MPLTHPHLDADRIALLKANPSERDAAIQWWARRLASQASDLARRSYDGAVTDSHPSEFLAAATAQVDRWIAGEPAPVPAPHVHRTSFWSIDLFWKFEFCDCLSRRVGGADEWIPS